MNHYVATITDDGYAVTNQFRKPVSLGRTMHDAIDRFLRDYAYTKYVGELDAEAWEHRLPKFVSVLAECELFDLLEEGDYNFDGVVNDRAHGISVATIRKAAGGERHCFAVQSSSADYLYERYHEPFQIKV